MIGGRGFPPLSCPLVAVEEPMREYQRTVEKVLLRIFTTNLSSISSGSTNDEGGRSLCNIAYGKYLIEDFSTTKGHEI